MFIFALIFIACLPLYVIRFSIAGFPTTIVEVLLLIWFAWWFIENYTGIVTRFKQTIFAKKLHRRYPFDWELILWLLLSLAAVITARSSLSTFGIWRAYFFEPALAFILFVNTFNTKEKILKAVSALAFSSIVVSLFAAYQSLTGDFISNAFWAQALERRATSLYPYPNAVGLYLAPLLCVFVGGFFTTFKEHKNRAVLYATAAIVSLCAILFARSDGALFALVTAAFVSLIVANNKTRIIAACLAVLAAGTLWFSLPLRNYVFERANLQDFSGQVRRLQWRETLKMLDNGKKLTGAGLTKYKEAVSPYHQDGFFYNKEKLPLEEFNARVATDEAFRKSHWQPLEIYLYPHNVFLNFWTELGFLGMLVFCWIVLKYARFGVVELKSLQQKKDIFAWLVLGLLAAMLTIIIHGLVDVPYFKNDLAIMFWLLVSFVGVLHLSKKTS